MALPPELVNFSQGLVGAGVGVYFGLKLALQRLEIRFENLKEAHQARFKAIEERQDTLGTRSHLHNEDLLILDIEMDDVCRQAQIPRKRRQKWRFDT